MSKKESPDDVVIVSAVRTPFGKFDGVMKTTLSFDIAIAALKESVKRINLDPAEVNEVYYGSCIPAEYALYLNVPARQVTLGAGFPESSISLTIDRACCSSMTAMRLGYQSIKSGTSEIVIASGAENMGNTALIAPAAKTRWGNRLGPVVLEDVLFELGYGRRGFDPVATEAGQVAIEYGVSREEQDKWAAESHKKWFNAYKEGKYKVGGELMEFMVPQTKGEPVSLVKDESPREDSSVEKLSKLKTVYGSPTVTAGNAPGMNSGASAIVMMSRKKAMEKGLAVLGVIDGVQPAAGKPKYMACIPAIAIEQLLEKNSLTIDKMDLIEINEAFAAITLVSLKMLAKDDPVKWEELKKKTNVNGGAIAIGHPVGASGARITMTLMYELMRRGGGRGVAAICGGLSQGEAILIRV